MAPENVNQSLVNIAGGVETTAAKVDGTSERVKVLSLHIKDFPRLMSAMGNECVQVDIFCGKDPGWAEKLTNDSIIKLYELGHQVNDSFFVSWGQRRIAEQEKFLPGIGAKLGFAVSTSGSPSSPSAPK